MTLQYGYTILCRTTKNLAVHCQTARYFVISKFYLSTSISNPDLNSTVSLFSYSVIFSTSLRTNCSSYHRLIYLFPKKVLISSILCRLPSLSASFAKNPGVVLSIYESHPRHPHIPFCHLPVSKATAAILQACSQSPQSAPALVLQYRLDILL